MSIPVQLGGLSEVRGTLAAGRDGRVLAASPAPGRAPEEEATAAATALGALATAGEAARLGPLLWVHARGAGSSIVSALRPDALLVVHVDPARATGPVESEVRRWAAGAAAPARTREAPRPAPPAAAPALAPAPAPAAPGPAARPASPWAALRRALARAHLVEAAALKSQLCGPSTGEAGAEPLPREACERALRALLEGAGSVMAGDGIGGARLLRPLTGEDQPNRSFRWLALHWSARAALRSGAVPAARAHVQASLVLARALDVEARALSQWTAAEVLAHDKDPSKALAWLAEARARFARSADAWGVGQTWLTEARVLAATGRPEEAAAAAAEASAALPGAEEPQVALARLAVLAGDLEGADRRLAGLRSPAAERLVALVAAVRAGAVAADAAAELLREQEATPGARALAALARIAGAAPRLPQARESLAWMLLRLGRYDEAAGHFRALLAQPLSAAERASATLGLGCAANGERPAASPSPAAPEPAAAGRPNGAAEAVFSGQLGSFALPDLVEFLRTARRTGLLVCSSAEGLGRLRFREGRITAGGAPATPGLLPLLVRAGALAPGALGGLAPEPGDGLEERLALRIVEGGMADRAAVSSALERRIGLAVRELVRWTEGEFAFRREEPGAPEAGLGVSLDAQGVLLDVFRELDEEARAAAPEAPA